MEIIYAIAILTGTIIGAGFFALPFIALKVGFTIILGYFLVLGGLVFLIHILFAELSLKTADFKRLPSFAQIYLGKSGQIFAYFLTIFGLVGTLLAYLIVGGEFLAELLKPFLGGSLFLYVFIYFSLGALLIYLGIKAIAKIEFWGLVLFFIVLIIIFLKGQGFINLENLLIGQRSLTNNYFDLFLPYGAVLFSLWGVNLIPEVEEILGKKKEKIFKVIFWAILIPIIVYLIFIYLILGVAGPETTDSALLGLRDILGDGTASLALTLGLLATFTSFITLGLTLKKTLSYDFKLNEKLAWLITCFLPLLLYLLGLQNFILVISALGGIMLSLEGILVLLMYKKIRPERKFLVYFLILFFFGGIIYTIVYFS